MEEETLAMLLDPDSEPEEDYYDPLCTLAMTLAYDVISDSRYLDRGTRGPVGRLPQ